MRTRIENNISTSSRGDGRSRCRLLCVEGAHELSKLLLAFGCPPLLWLVAVLAQHISWHFHGDLSIFLLAHNFVPPRPHDIWVFCAIDAILLISDEASEVDSRNTTPQIAREPLRMP